MINSWTRTSGTESKSGLSLQELTIHYSCTTCASHPHLKRWRISVLQTLQSTTPGSSHCRWSQSWLLAHHSSTWRWGSQHLTQSRHVSQCARRPQSRLPLHGWYTQLFKQLQWLRIHANVIRSEAKDLVWVLLNSRQRNLLRSPRRWPRSKLKLTSDLRRSNDDLGFATSLALSNIVIMAVKFVFRSSKLLPQSK